MTQSTWSPSPAAPTIQTMQKIVAGYVGMPTDDEALDSALAGIRMAIDRVNQRTWNWAVTFEDIPFDTAIVDYPLPANFKKTQRFMICDSSSNPVFRLPFKTWQSFLNEHPESTSAGSPCVYSTANVKQYGTLSLDVFPTTDWVAQYPTGRLFYYRKVQYDNADGQPDWPSEVTPFVLAWAEGFVADRYAQAKAQAAYSRAEMSRRELIADDNEQQTDWE
jgi:hypothetical protein